ncbi:two-component system response regulator RegX3 [Amycolatopsis bartoniae]|uniref:Sensory transduction protein RegX3 n=1 Tax=Amycolatopsis bartoniae TaxID=941986 RepID=A0A8H9MG87_9PSEU|nr:response regulator transcription factor [Amycolatopsis bartoniae]MBB2937336.1 two-component system response regulator RegX3 [Amycolatopsis bartoniae]TVT07969.1 response regulator transcription factor [Amycolatopsis bartoniae]GHF78267.1 sensory transduction protein regX3 [Amycolatopsis bartoniae]
MTRVLIVDHETASADSLASSLRDHGFSTVVTTDGPTGLTEFDRRGADIVLLDLILPGMPGTDLCRRLRAGSGVPVIVVSARDNEVDKIVSLELGADDYVTKPYSVRELVARMRAVLRRGRLEPDHPEPPPDPEPPAEVLAAGPVRIDADRHVVTVHGEEVHIPLKEFELLECLLRSPGRMLTRAKLIGRVWGADYVGDTKTLDVHIGRLRAKVERDPAHPRHLLTVRGLGFKFEP